jgi:hypothetical protein
LSHVHDDTNNSKWGVDPKGGLYLLKRDDDSALISGMFSRIYNEGHVSMLNCPIVLPEEAYFKPYLDLSSAHKAQVMWKAWWAVNSFCREKRLIKHAADNYKLSYYTAASLATAFGN